MASSNAIKKREAKRRGLRNPVFEENQTQGQGHISSSESIQSLLDNESNTINNYQNNQVFIRDSRAPPSGQ